MQGLFEDDTTIDIKAADLQMPLARLLRKIAWKKLELHENGTHALL